MDRLLLWAKWDADHRGERDAEERDHQDPRHRLHKVAQSDWFERREGRLVEVGHGASHAPTVALAVTYRRRPKSVRHHRPAEQQVAKGTTS